MKDKFLKLHNLLAGIRPERQTIKSQIAEQEAWLKKYSKVPDDFVREIGIAKGKIAELQAGERAKNQQIHKALLESAQELADLLEAEVKKPIDLTDSKFFNALQIASLVNFGSVQKDGLK